MLGKIAGVQQDGRPDDVRSFKVAVRCRPFNVWETEGVSRAEQPFECCNKCVTLRKRGGSPTRAFGFDHSFGPGEAQNVVFESIGAPLVQNALNAINSCIFAYGLMGSGKTYTMVGDIFSDAGQGLLPRACSHLFLRLEEQRSADPSFEAMVLASYLELCNEKVFDLLAGGRQNTSELQISLHPTYGSIVVGLTECPVRRCHEALELLDFGAKMRALCDTQTTVTSSRSHVVFTVQVRMKSQTSKGLIENQVKLQFLDLAGSEQRRKTTSAGDQLEKGASINRSLATLQRVIVDLTKASGRNVPPFRDSTLTMLLKDALMGSSHTTLLACISPSKIHLEETIHTLEFASRCRKLKTRVKRNDQSKQDIIIGLQSERAQIETELQLEKEHWHARCSNIQKELDSVLEQNKIVESGIRQRMQIQERLQRCLEIVTVPHHHRSSEFQGTPRQRRMTTKSPPPQKRSEGTRKKKALRKTLRVTIGELDSLEAVATPAVPIGIEETARPIRSSERSTTSSGRFLSVHSALGGCGMLVGDARHEPAMQQRNTKEREFTSTFSECSAYSALGGCGMLDGIGNFKASFREGSAYTALGGCGMLDGVGHFQSFKDQSAAQEFEFTPTLSETSTFSALGGWGMHDSVSSSQSAAQDLEFTSTVSETSAHSALGGCGMRYRVDGVDNAGVLETDLTPTPSGRSPRSVVSGCEISEPGDRTGHNARHEDQLVVCRDLLEVGMLESSYNLGGCGTFDGVSFCQPLTDLNAKHEVQFSSLSGCGSLPSIPLVGDAYDRGRIRLRREERLLQLINRRVTTQANAKVVHQRSPRVHQRSPRPSSSGLPPIGALVMVTLEEGDVYGTVRYAGDVPFTKGNIVGIELNVDKGKNDGCVNGCRYFSCAPLHGIFLRPNLLKVQDDMPGEYRITQKVPVTEIAELGSGMQIAEILEGTTVIVEDVVMLANTHIIRGSIADPAGWISLFDPSSNVRWATRGEPRNQCSRQTLPTQSADYARVIPEMQKRLKELELGDHMQLQLCLHHALDLRGALQEEEEERDAREDELKMQMNALKCVQDTLEFRHDQIAATCEEFQRQRHGELSKLGACFAWEGDQNDTSCGSVWFAQNDTPRLVTLHRDPALQGCLVYYLPVGSTTIGSDEQNCCITVTGVSVSAMVCTITNDANQVLVIKAAKCALARVNGFMVSESDMLLADGDHLAIGRACIFRVHVPSIAKDQIATVNTEMEFEVAMAEILSNAEIDSEWDDVVQKAAVFVKAFNGPKAASELEKDACKASEVCAMANDILRMIPDRCNQGAVRFEVSVLLNARGLPNVCVLARGAGEVGDKQQVNGGPSIGIWDIDQFWNERMPYLCDALSEATALKSVKSQWRSGGHPASCEDSAHCAEKPQSTDSVLLDDTRDIPPRKQKRNTYRTMVRGVGRAVRSSLWASMSTAASKLISGGDPPCDRPGIADDDGDSPRRKTADELAIKGYKSRRHKSEIGKSSA